jgi:hypothetical protein
MATYKHVGETSGDGWYLVNPSGFLDAVKLAWYLWRYPTKVAALVNVNDDFVRDHCTIVPPNA